MKFSSTILFLLLFNGSFACVCSDNPTIKKSYDASDLVIIGSVVEIEHKAFSKLIPDSTIRIDNFKYYSDSIMFNQPHLTVVTFKVQQIYKTDTTIKVMEIVTPRSHAACGYTNFKIGEKYIVFGFSSNTIFPFNDETLQNYVDDEIIWTSQCIATGKYNKEEHNELIKLDN